MNASHRPIVVEAVLRTPISVTDPIHLDGVLLAAREKRHGPGSRGRPLDCVAWDDGFHRCSASFLVSDELGGVATVATTRVARLDLKSRDGELFVPPDGSEKISRKSREDVIGPMSAFRGVTRDFEVATGVRSLVWQVLGDPEGMLDLLSEIRCVGRMYTTGWGQVDEWLAHDCAADQAFCGAAVAGRPMRNLPAASAARFGIDADLTYPGRIEPPYGSRFDLVPIVAPTRIDLTGTTQAARRTFAFDA
ncbi:MULTISPECIES: hypothetical protein [Methylorubrum]|jgi:hypothetical protein|uniref:Uncharacterized protein n=1 Tax=Methylorubrum extorquens (strain ATCC 14718 / DSM 1338 / JCM 2805 / NCIMB 9133 / AM1) TaxID=272630 RepID=C5B4T2_METEA|nr:hypothetical protein [Methylorubrum extorquens]ACS43464.1 Hypothetical protein MexAM1_META2p0617 [Methylorubrum extorquens AM1]MCP1545445.1 hypothetical protein [Methylorubrum extorquens]MCP1591396.1 hypothetical protein [Methylorubrum extorquens]OAH41051.1 hypothetical protein AX289_31865 [Methylorubrum populi]